MTVAIRMARSGLAGPALLGLFRAAQGEGQADPKAELGLIASGRSAKVASLMHCSDTRLPENALDKFRLGLRVSLAIVPVP